ncbi:precorrin-6A/cobalt-precorrin-6A reductase [Jannaschia sp. Os4]|uniref:precorrin-6A/cobalt-precorrin-6A reductase n=1 Tax=Jannaschia sp. Os4 TaxID=2807617 RepID=UPI001939EA33|nr:precorrin-6A/cobalt-precorrin-6A reductase [Jannaschia sp. Os4]MBM2576424.1 precorrin-6A/cobalt-precorrin-6A reductase [Jannaschia sp. Os4]
MTRPVLVLAGTEEARHILHAARDLRLLASLAGTTRRPRDLHHPTRVGGFGGEDGFRAALRDAAGVLDATHPFAATMSERAARIARETGTPHLRYTRPPWPFEPHWHRHPDATACAAALPPGARVLLATGPGSLAPFEDRIEDGGLHLLVRRVDPAPPREGVTWRIGGPGDAAEETALMRTERITHLVTKNAGGARRGKLDAARTLGIETHVIDRPPPPPGEETHDQAEALAFLRAHAAPR